jgi:hypothetical protein
VNEDAEIASRQVVMWHDTMRPIERTAINRGPVALNLEWLIMKIKRRPFAPRSRGLRCVMAWSAEA